MSAFRFRLARLQRVRELREELARGALLEAEAALKSAQRRVDARRDALDRALDDVERVQAHGRIAPLAVLNAQATLAPLDTCLRESRTDAVKLAQAQQVAHAAWQDARTRARALGHLEERAHGIWIDEQRRREERAADERIARKMNSARAGSSEVTQ